jgi:hypothetical protein
VADGDGAIIVLGWLGNSTFSRDRSDGAGSDRIPKSQKPRPGRTLSSMLLNLGMKYTKNANFEIDFHPLNEQHF